LAYELSKANIKFEIEKSIPIKDKNVNIDCSFRADIIVENCIIVELKTVYEILPIHEAQLLTYLKITGIKLGLILNFNVSLLTDGIKRMII
jgi:GxxExxY protein